MQDLQRAASFHVNCFSMKPKTVGRAPCQEVVLQGEAPPPERIPLSADPVIDVSWSADGRWLACTVATGGGVRTLA